jgi:ATP-dependent Clp protease ATP-binding subunit ClpA
MAFDDAAGKKVFVGRDKEINDILSRLNQDNSTRILLVGESGVGKSALLDEIYRRLTTKEEGMEDQENKAFVGYYDKSSSLVAPSQSSIEPFNIVLASLIKGAKQKAEIN